MMTVRPFEHGRFYVTSSKGNTEYLVDVNYKGRFRCSCKNHGIMIEWIYEKGKEPKRPCKHARAVIDFLGLQVIERLRVSNPEEMDPT